MTRPAITVLGAVFVFFAVTAPAAESEIYPRRISDAERYAVELVARYLQEGPFAIDTALAASSPFASLPAAERLQEIEVRMGPWSDAAWELRTVVPSLADTTAVFAVEFPSGLDDTVILTLEPHEDSFRIQSIRTLAEPSPRAVSAADESTIPPAAGPPAPSRLPLIGIVVAMTLALPAALFRKDHHATLALVMSVLFTVLCLIWFGATRMVKSTTQVQQTNAVVTGPPRLSPLLDLRRSLTGYGEPVYVEPNLDDPRIRSVASLWKAQAALTELRQDEVESLLIENVDPAAPLTHVLQARFAALQAREADAIIAYERAIDLGPGHDGLWTEAAETFWILGFSGAAQGYVDRLRSIASRDSSAWYLDSILRTGLRGYEERVTQSFRMGWNLVPMERTQVLHNSQLWAVLEDGDTRRLVDLISVNEPLIMMPTIDSEEIELPAGTDAFVCGKLLVARIGRNELHVPGGARMSPSTAPRIDAGDWQRRRLHWAIEDLPRLVEQVTAPGALTQPALRRRMTSTASALSERNRWEDLIRLTQSISPSDELVPAHLSILRADALNRTGQLREAEAVLIQLLRSPALERSQGFETWFKIGEMLGAVGRYDLGIKSLEIAAKRSPGGWFDDRIRQFSMEERLTSYRHHRTEHFEIRYPEEAGREKAVRMGEILEAELKRLAKWIPVDDFSSTTVHVLSWEEFRRTYTSSDHILAFYDGKIRFPFADTELMPQLIAIMSHELAHAMIAQATRDQAPHWFHEGLAQHVEPLRYKSNPFTRYEEDQIIALSVADGVLTGYPEPSLTGMAYLESLAFIRFIESRFGTGGIHRMLDLFEGGATSRDAIETLAGTDPVAFEREFRKWGRSGAPAMWVDD